MKAIFFSFLLPLSLLSASAFALPSALEATQAALVKTGTCEANWRDQAGDLEQMHFDIAQGIRLWIVPCAHWSLNVQATAYLEIAEPSQPEGVIIHALQFVDYDPAQKVYGTPILMNVQFDKEKKLLQSRQYFQTGQVCGSASQYHFDLGQQRFLLDKLIENDDCKTPNGNWKKVF